MIDEFFKIRIKVIGLNQSKIYKVLRSKNIEISKISKQDYKTLYFNINGRNKQKCLQYLSNLCYTTTVEKNYGFFWLLEFTKKRLGFCIGSIIFFIIILASNFFVWNVEVYSSEKISTAEIKLALQNSGIKSGTLISAVDIEKTEQFLLKKFSNISFASVIKKGSTIIVNVY